MSSLVQGCFPSVGSGTPDETRRVRLAKFFAQTRCRVMPFPRAMICIEQGSESAKGVVNGSGVEELKGQGDRIGVPRASIQLVIFVFVATIEIRGTVCNAIA